jgi:hypothetical protein
MHFHFIATGVNLNVDYGLIFEERPLGSGAGMIVGLA